MTALPPIGADLQHRLHRRAEIGEGGLVGAVRPGAHRHDAGIDHADHRAGAEIDDGEQPLDRPAMHGGAGAGGLVAGHAQQAAAALLRRARTSRRSAARRTAYRRRCSRACAWRPASRDCAMVSLAAVSHSSSSTPDCASAMLRGPSTRAGRQVDLGLRHGGAAAEHDMGAARRRLAGEHGGLRRLGQVHRDEAGGVVRGAGGAQRGDRRLDLRPRSAGRADARRPCRPSPSRPTSSPARQACRHPRAPSRRRSASQPVRHRTARDFACSGGWSRIRIGKDTP